MVYLQNFPPGNLFLLFLPVVAVSKFIFLSFINFSQSEQIFVLGSIATIPFPELAKASSA